MENKLFVGNIVFSATEDDIRSLFSEAGEVDEVSIVMDRETGRPRGFAFVTMATEEGAQEAIERLSDYDFQGRPLKVNVARPREDRPSGGGRGFGGNRGGFGGGRGGFGGGDRGGRGGDYGADRGDKFRKRFSRDRD